METLAEQIANFLAYSSQYRDKGVKFTYTKKVKVSKKPEHLAGLSVSERSVDRITVMNENVENGIVKKFIEMRYKSEKKKFTYEDFLIRELEILEKYKKPVRDLYEYQYYPIVRSLKERLEKLQKGKVTIKLKPEKKIKTKIAPQVESFEELFSNIEFADPCLKMLMDLEKPVINSDNHYIGNNKGVFPLWVKLLIKNSKMRKLSDITFSYILNKKIKNLNLQNDGREFRHNYSRLEKDSVENQLLKAIKKLPNLPKTEN